MNKFELRKIWTTAIAHLEEAKSLIPSSENVSPLLKRYQEWLDHNELELALDELENVAELVDCPRPFWLALREAANTMGLTERARALAELLEEKYSND